MIQFNLFDFHIYPFLSLSPTPLLSVFFSLSLVKLSPPLLTSSNTCHNSLFSHGCFSFCSTAFLGHGWPVKWAPCSSIAINFTIFHVFFLLRVWNLQNHVVFLLRMTFFLTSNVWIFCRFEDILPHHSFDNFWHFLVYQQLINRNGSPSASIIFILFLRKIVIITLKAYTSVIFSYPSLVFSFIL